MNRSSNKLNRFIKQNTLITKTPPLNPIKTENLVPINEDFQSINRYETLHNEFRPSKYQFVNLIS